VSSPAIERRLTQARECLQATDYGCSWRSVRYVLQREPDNEAALSIEDEILNYVDRKVVEFEQAMGAADLTAAQAALTDAQTALNYDHSDPRLDEMSQRLAERQQAQQRPIASMQRPFVTTGPTTPAADPVVQELLSEAQQSLERGDLNAAESLANKVLSRDAANPVAPEILRQVAAEKERIKRVLMESTQVKDAVKVK
jgi:hypothetical protein